MTIEFKKLNDRNWSIVDTLTGLVPIRSVSVKSGPPIAPLL